MPMPDSESVFVIPGSVLLWRIAPRPPNSAQVRLGLLKAASLCTSSSDGALSSACAGPVQAACGRGQMSSKCPQLSLQLAPGGSFPSPESQCVGAVHRCCCLAGGVCWDGTVGACLVITQE